MTVGPLIAGAGLVLLARIAADSSYQIDVLPAVVVFAVGPSMKVVPLTATALASVPRRKVGMASAVNNDISRAAGLLAVAVLPGIAGITPMAYDHPAQLSTGYQHAMLIAAALFASGGVLSLLLLKGRAATPVVTPERRAPRLNRPGSTLAVLEQRLPKLSILACAVPGHHPSRRELVCAVPDRHPSRRS